MPSDEFAEIEESDSDSESKSDKSLSFYSANQINQTGDVSVKE